MNYAPFVDHLSSVTCSCIIAHRSSLIIALHAAWRTRTRTLRTRTPHTRARAAHGARSTRTAHAHVQLRTRLALAAAGCWLLAAGCWLLAAGGHWRLAAGGRAWMVPSRWFSREGPFVGAGAHCALESASDQLRRRGGCLPHDSLCLLPPSCCVVAPQVQLKLK
jgi:hypothetical protein